MFLKCFYYHIWQWIIFKFTYFNSQGVIKSWDIKIWYEFTEALKFPATFWMTHEFWCLTFDDVKDQYVIQNGVYVINKQICHEKVRWT